LSTHKLTSFYQIGQQEKLSGRKSGAAMQHEAQVIMLDEVPIYIERTVMRALQSFHTFNYFTLGLSDGDACPCLLGQLGGRSDIVTGPPNYPYK
jgi:hypothetical protein